MNLGFKIKEHGKKLELEFEERIERKERKLSELLEDEVIMDLDNGRELLKEKSDVTIYEVYNLWKYQKSAKSFLERYGLMVDLTLLKSGVFSKRKKGEAFCTYGHIHEKNLGEAYEVLKNECYLLLSNRKNFKSYLIKLKEGNSFFIHPSYMHRLISGKKDCVVLNFVPEDAGHDYSIVKRKGFPFHIFYDEKGNLEFRENKKYPETRLVLIEGLERFSVIEFAEKEPEKLKKILENPKDIYKLTKDYL